MARTLQDTLSDSLAPVKRRVNDIILGLTGTRTSLLRITNTDKDLFGESDEYLDTSVILDGRLKLPWGSDIELFISKDVTNTTSIDSIDIIDLLPFELTLQLTKSPDTNPVDVMVDDILVYVHYDENDNKTPMIFQVTRIKGSFSGRNITKKVCEMSLLRGDQEQDIQTVIDNYVNNLTKV